MESRKFVKRIVLLSDLGAEGKHLLEHLMSRPLASAASTDSVNQYHQNVLINKELFALEIIEVAGGLKQATVLAGYLIGADYIWLVSHANRPESLADLKKDWGNVIDSYAPNAERALLLWKCDLGQKRNQEETVQQLASAIGVDCQHCYQLSPGDKKDVTYLFTRFYQSLEQKNTTLSVGKQVKTGKSYSRFGQLLKNRGRKLLLGFLFAGFFALTAYFLWPVMLGAVVTLFAGASPLLLASGLAGLMTAGGLLLSGLGAFAVDRSVDACAKPGQSTEEDKEELIKQLLIEDYPLIENKDYQGYHSLSSTH